MHVSFDVIGKPYGKQRPRRARNIVYTPRENVEYEARVSEAFRKAPGAPQSPFDGPVAILMNLVFEPPRSASKTLKRDMIEGSVYPTKKPDIDNCVKSIMDGLNGVAYLDDRQVVAIVVNKRYGDQAKVAVTIGEV